MIHIWKRVLDILMSLVIPPLADKESNKEPLKSEELHIVFQWLKVSGT